MSMSRHYGEVIDDLKRGVCNSALLVRASKAIEELLTMHQLDQAEIVRLRRWIERLEEGNTDG